MSLNPETSAEEVEKYYEREQKKRNVNLILSGNLTEYFIANLAFIHSGEQKAKMLQSDVWDMCRLIEGVKYRFSIARIYLCVDQEWKYRFQGCLFLVEVEDGCNLVLVEVESMKVVWTHELFMAFEMSQRDDHFVVINDQTPEVAWGLSFARLYPCEEFVKETTELVERKCRLKKKEGGIIKSVVSFFSGAGKISNAMSPPPPPVQPPVQVTQSQKEADKDTKWMMNMLEKAGYKKEELVEDENSRVRVQKYFSAYENQEEGKSMFESIIDIPKFDSESPEVAYPDLDGLTLPEVEQPPEKLEPEDLPVEPEMSSQQQFVPQQAYHQPTVEQGAYLEQQRKMKELEQRMNNNQQQPSHHQNRTSVEHGVYLEQQRKMKELEQRMQSFEQREVLEEQRMQEQVIKLKRVIAQMEREKSEDIRLAQCKERLLMILLKQEARNEQGRGRMRRRVAPQKPRTRYNVNHGLVGRNTFQEDYRM